MSCVILLTHFVVFFHTVAHEIHDSHHNDIIITSADVEFKQNDSLNEDCKLCDVYLDLDLEKSFLQSTYSFISHLFSKDIFQLDNNLDSITLYLKQSRSPPNCTKYI